MPFCIRCSPFSCDTPGLISLTLAAQSNVQPIDDETCVSSSFTGKYIAGPGIVNVSLSAYAFEKGEDKWLGGRCKGVAQASQSNIQRYDFITDKWWIIPTKQHKAQIEGQIGQCSIKTVMFEGATANSQIVNNTSITTEMGIQIGAEFKYEGKPLPIEIPNLQAYSISIGEGLSAGYISSINVSVDFPEPAVASYSFEFPLDNS